MCVPDVVKGLNIKVFNLMSRTIETKNIKWHEICKCKCGLDATICNNKQHWNNDRCQCGCKELIYRGVCDKDFIWNPSNCECDYKACDFSEYLDYKNCICKKGLVNKLVEECNKTIEEEVKILDKNEDKCNSRTCVQFSHSVHCVVFSIFYNQCWNWCLFCLP